MGGSERHGASTQLCAHPAWAFLCRWDPIKNPNSGSTKLGTAREESSIGKSMGRGQCLEICGGAPGRWWHTGQVGTPGDEGRREVSQGWGQPSPTLSRGSWCPATPCLSFPLHRARGAGDGRGGARPEPGPAVVSLLLLSPAGATRGFCSELLRHGSALPKPGEARLHRP